MSVFYNADEIVAYLRRTNLPTILVEGKDDMRIYRWIEEKVKEKSNLFSLDLLQCKGRNNLLKVYDRREEFQHIDVLFFADLDTWLFKGVPEKYKEVSFTHGYSIENDFYYAFKSQIENLIDSGDRENYYAALGELSKWFSFEINNHLNDIECCFDYHIKYILDEKTKKIKPIFAQNRSMEIDRIYSITLYQEILDEYYLKIRGKNLMELWELFMENQKYNRNHLYISINALINENYFYDAKVNEIVDYFSGNKQKELTNQPN